MFNISNNTTMPNSSHSKKEIMQLCSTTNKSSNEPSIPYFSESQFILIDDDEMMRTAWSIAAEITGKNLSLYSSFEKFISMIHHYSKNSKVYIDSDLGNNIKGEECAKKLYEMGFTTIYLTTGHSPEQFGYLPWIKEIVGKDPLLIL